MAVPVPVLTAVTGATWEASLVAKLETTGSDIAVVRRCVDLPDLLATAASGTARAVLLSARLRRLDRDALRRLATAQVVVVGLVTPGDDAAEQRLRELGVLHVLPADAEPSAISAAVSAALVDQEHTPVRASYAEPLAAFDNIDGGVPFSRVGAVPDGGAGALVAVWGPTGAPGRTTVAVGIAAELALLRVPTLLVDCDVYGGVIAQLLGFLDEAPGLAAATRLANNGQLDLRALAQLAPVAASGLRVLTGISRPARWPELRPSALERVYALARELAAITVVDCGFGLEQDEELSFDTAAPRRNGATLSTLEQADTVVVVGAADPVGMQRLLRGLAELRDTFPGIVPRVVLNKVRRTAVGPDPTRQLREALMRHAAADDVVFLPYDREALDRAVLQGRALCEVAAESGARVALRELAAAVAGVQRPARRRRLSRMLR